MSLGAIVVANTSAEERALRIALLAVEVLTVSRANGVTGLTFDEAVRGYGRDIGVTPEMARAAVEGPLTEVLEEIKGGALQEATHKVPVYDSDSGEVVTVLKFPYETVARRYVKNESWRRYGLSVDPGTPLEDGIKRQDAIANYLDTHPEVSARYKADQTGEVKYYDVLALVMQEES